MTGRPRGSGPTRREGPEIIYDCTFGCGQSYTTLEEWKEHEISTHMQEAEQHVYVCHEFVPVDEEPNQALVTHCGGAFRGVNAFDQHLARDHQKVSFKLDLFSISAAHGFRYWCGFCNSTKTLGLGGAVERPFWWDSRAGHIQVHYAVERRVADYGGWKLPGEDARRRKDMNDMIKGRSSDNLGP